MSFNVLNAFAHSYLFEQEFTFPNNKWMNFAGTSSFQQEGKLSPQSIMEERRELNMILTDMVGS